MNSGKKHIVTKEFLMEAFSMATRQNPQKITIEGPHGIGKTALVLATIKEFLNKYNEDLKFWQVSVPTADPIHIAGLPEILTDSSGNKSVSFIALKDLLEADVIFFDELTRPAGPEVTNAMFELVNQGTINGEPINARIIIGAYNPGDVEGYDTMPLDPALADRFNLHFTMSHLPDSEVVGELLHNPDLGTAIAKIGKEYDKLRREAKDATSNDSGLPYISPRKWVALGKNWQLFGKNTNAIKFSFECVTPALSLLFDSWNTEMQNTCKYGDSTIMAVLDIKDFKVESISLEGWRGAGDQPMICSAVREPEDITNSEHFLTFGGDDMNKRLYLLPYLLVLENNIKGYIAQINDDPNSGRLFNDVEAIFKTTINDLRILKNTILDVMPGGVFSDSIRLEIRGENQDRDDLELEDQSIIGAFRMPYALLAFKKGIDWSRITDQAKRSELEEIIKNAEKDLASVFNSRGGNEFFDLFVKVVNSDSTLFKILTTTNVDELKKEITNVMNDIALSMNDAFADNEFGEVVATARILDILPEAIKYVDTLFTDYCFDDDSVIPPNLADTSVEGMLVIDPVDTNQIKRVEYAQFKEIYHNVSDWMNDMFKPEVLDEFFPTLKG